MLDGVSDAWMAQRSDVAEQDHPLPRLHALYLLANICRAPSTTAESCLGDDGRDPHLNLILISMRLAATIALASALDLRSEADPLRVAVVVHAACSKWVSSPRRNSC